MVIGSGVYRIGRSVEFDWCGFRAIQELRRISSKRPSCPTLIRSSTRLFLTFARYGDGVTSGNHPKYGTGMGQNFMNNISIITFSK